MFMSGGEKFGCVAECHAGGFASTQHARNFFDAFVGAKWEDLCMGATVGH